MSDAETFQPVASDGNPAIGGPVTLRQDLITKLTYGDVHMRLEYLAAEVVDAFVEWLREHEDRIVGTSIVELSDLLDS